MANPQKENGFTPISNEILDYLCLFRIPGEIRCVFDVVLRKTWGWGKKEDWIAQTQIIKMTKMLKGNVSRSLSKLITHKLVIKTDNKLRLNKNYEEWIKFGKLSKVITKVIKTDNQELSKLITKVIRSEGNKRNYTKDTITKETIQKKYTSLNNITQLDLEEIAKKYKVPTAFVISKLDDMENWMEAKGKRYKNYKRALMNWVKKDAIKIISSAKKNESKYVGATKI